MSTIPHVLTLHPDAAVDAERGSIAVTHFGRTITLPSAPPGIPDALDRLAPPGDTDDALAETVLARGGQRALASWYGFLAQLDEAAAVCRTITLDGTPFATLTPTSRLFRPAPSGDTCRDSPCRLSRFAFMRERAGVLVLESARGLARIELHDTRAATCVAALGAPDEDARTGVDPETFRAFRALLEGAGMLVPSGGANPESSDPSHAITQWEFADRLFHARSRRGTHESPVGGTFRFAGRTSPLAATKPPMSGERIALTRADEAANGGPPFWEILDQRCSIRAYGEQPITVRELGVFLFRTARVRDVTEPDGDRLRYQITSRPYPSGGACYPLELYVVVGRCEGLAAGLYHYDPQGHALEALDSSPEDRAHLLAENALVEHYGPRQILIVITARFQRVMWKYESMSYATILKDVGVLMQTMYLAATAMGLGPCALGAGNAALFSRMVGLDDFAEASVGEFLLGSLPDDMPTA